jgi:hypothetical protein
VASGHFEALGHAVVKFFKGLRCRKARSHRLVWQKADLHNTFAENSHTRNFLLPSIVQLSPFNCCASNPIALNRVI